MSTRMTIRHESDETTKTSFHLYHDEQFADEPEDVYLELEGFHFEASSIPDLSFDPIHARPRIVVKIPTMWAKKLNLIK
jgi:hypothetical protein